MSVAKLFSIVSLTTGLITFVSQGLLTGKEDVLIWSLVGGGILAITLIFGMRINQDKVRARRYYAQQKAAYEELLAWGKVLSIYYPKAKKDSIRIWNKAYQEGYDLDTYNIDVNAANIMNEFDEYQIARRAFQTYWYFDRVGHAYLAA